MFFCAGCGAGRESDVSLFEGDLWLLRVAVLRDQIAGVAREHDVIDLALTARAKVDHFPDVRKMVDDPVPRDFAGCFRLENCIQEVLPFGAAQQMLEITRRARSQVAV